MSASVTLKATPATQQYGVPIVFSGRVLYDGEPVQGLGIGIWEVISNTGLIGVETDLNGYYSVAWTPPFEWIGTFQVATLAPMMEGFWSPPVTLTVTEEKPPVSPNLAIPIVIGLAAVLLLTGKK